MKKHLLLILVAGFFTLASCSSDDDGDTETGEAIVGTWVLTEVNPALINPQECEQESTITLNQDKTGSGEFYLETNDCEVETSSGNWRYEGNDIYFIEVPFLGGQEGRVEFEGADRFYFTSQEVTGITLTFDRQ